MHKKYLGLFFIVAILVGLLFFNYAMPKERVIATLSQGQSTNDSKISQELRSQSSYMAHDQAVRLRLEEMIIERREFLTWQKNIRGEQEQVWKQYEGLSQVVASQPPEKHLSNETEKPIFNSQPIDERLKKRIMGVSWQEGSPVALNELRYLTISHWSFEDQVLQGELIVHKDVAEEVLEIFKELYENKYYIEKMKLIDDYNASDDASMADNNTSSFCYRQITGGSQLSRHSYGLAIDINPLYNPYVHGNQILPPQGEAYVDRSQYIKGMIMKDDLCYKAFVKRGWEWGGDWATPLDYQHFEKKY